MGLELEQHRGGEAVGGDQHAVGVDLLGLGRAQDRGLGVVQELWQVLGHDREAGCQPGVIQVGSLALHGRHVDGLTLLVRQAGVAAERFADGLDFGVVDAGGGALGCLAVDEGVDADVQYVGDLLQDAEAVELAVAALDHVDPTHRPAHAVGEELPGKPAALAPVDDPLRDLRAGCCLPLRHGHRSCQFIGLAWPEA